MNHEKEMRAFMEAIAPKERVDLLSAQQTLEMLAEYADQKQDAFKDFEQELVKLQNQMQKMKRETRTIGREIKDVVPEHLYSAFMYASDYISKVDGSFDLAYSEMASAMNLFDTVEKEADKLSRG
jgi:predicted  nucleic acid-binding Zn-ribbon protein